MTFFIFSVVAVLVIVLASVFMSVSIKTTISLAKIGQGVVTFALIAVAGVVCLLIFAASHQSAAQPTTDDWSDLAPRGSGEATPPPFDYSKRQAVPLPEATVVPLPEATVPPRA